MNNLTVLGKFLDQPRLVARFSKAVPTLLIGGGVGATCYQVKKSEKEDRYKTAVKSACVLTGAIGAALICTRGIKRFNIKGLSEQIDLKTLTRQNEELIDKFLKQNKVSKKTSDILEKGKKKVLNFFDIKNVFKELKQTKNGKEFLNKLIPEPENITSKQIFKEIKNLSLMGLMPVVGGIGGGIIGDRLTDKKNWKKKIPDKIKEGTYQYLANIFLCNVGAGLALGALEKAKITSKAARATGMTAGIAITGVIGGSAIANKISQKIISPILDKKKITKNGNKIKTNLYEERKPDAMDVCLHIDDIATVAVLSGLKWINPSLPIFYAVSGYRTGVGYRNNKKDATRKE